jgi:hypothetical protein
LIRRPNLNRVKLAKFKQNISALAVDSSFHICITRKEEIFTEPLYLLPPFDEEMNIYEKHSC